MADSQTHLWRAAMWMLATLASFSLMAVAIRELAGALSAIQMIFFRGTIALLIISLVVSLRGWQIIRFDHWQVHLGRNISHFGGQLAWVYGLTLLPMAAVFALEFTVPCWTLIAAAILLGERVTWPRLLAIVLGISGVWCILQPGDTNSLFGQPASLIVLAGAAAYGIAHTLTRKLATNEHPLAILFFMSAIQWPLSAIPMLWHWTLPQGSQWGWLLIIGLTGLTAHYAMSRALALADAAIVVPMDFLRLPAIAVIAFWLYGEPLSASIMVGGLLMLAGNLQNLWHERKPIAT